MIIVVANSKGGVGKSTLAVHLAVWLHEQGHSVTLADCDMQQSSSEWAKEAAPDLKTVRLSSPEEILDLLPQLAQETDYVVADGPGSNTETSRALLLRADLALVPCKASMLEVRRPGPSHQSAQARPGRSQRAAAGDHRTQHGGQALPSDARHEKCRGVAGPAHGENGAHPQADLRRCAPVREPSSGTWALAADRPLKKYAHSSAKPCRR